MIKLLITGYSGFVAKNFVEYLSTKNERYDILGIDIVDPLFKVSTTNSKVRVAFRKVNMLDEILLAQTITEFLPDYVLHLAAFSSVAYSWRYPAESFLNNSNIFLNLVRQIQKCNEKCRILSVGSSEEYGDVGEKDIPICEEQPLNPLSPYAVARVAQEQLSKVYVDAFNMDIVLTRSFNHIGPGQDDRFAIPSFINKILQYKRANVKVGEIEVGDLSIIRDFVDVRDVVKAYYSLLIEGQKGEVYNVCSGRPVMLEEVVHYISETLGVNIKTKTCADLIRPNDNRIMVGNPEKMYKSFGWKADISLEQSLTDMIFLKQNI